MNQGGDIIMKQGISTNMLKILAIVAMVCDHAPYLMQDWQNYYYVSPIYLLHAFGRLTAPIFFFLLALGYRRTRNANRYTVRLLVFALLAYMPYILYFKATYPNAQNFMDLNVIFTMLLGLLLLRSLHEIQNVPLKVIAVALCLIGGYWCDYGLYGLAMILVCDIAQNSRRGTVLGMAAVMMTYIFVRLSAQFPGDAGPFDYLNAFAANPRLVNYLIVMLCQFIPLILIAFNRTWYAGAMGERRPSFLAKWGFYIFYPAHITALLLIRMYLL